MKSYWRMPFAILLAATSGSCARMGAESVQQHLVTFEIGTAPAPPNRPKGIRRRNAQGQTCD